VLPRTEFLRPCLSSEHTGEGAAVRRRDRWIRSQSRWVQQLPGPATVAFLRRSIHAPVLAAGWQAEVCPKLGRNRKSQARLLVLRCRASNRIIGSNTEGLLGILEHERDAIMTPVAAANKCCTFAPMAFLSDYRRRSNDRGLFPENRWSFSQVKVPFST
jgi:hypothetical protein